ncbi:uncharacterized protein Dana_GF15408 [Drosophila ananassae]|uniref:Uncharacterized protein n=1 Tax=Drosophila ananassae TaxID=7217 RepID=B3MKJ2_DROAN|nr:uncharacterized protein LOC6498217 [Drosophila ananassae]EDV31545.1 uncharacterized protein Dana_GF15408 [Drosophila ananassae]
MSYLLTEIALEMLGYKFYDTNGTFHLTNFQNNTAHAETNSDEPSLSEFIEQPESSNGEPQTRNGAASHWDVEREKELQLPASGFQKPRRTPAKALAKIMDYESDKIASQIAARLEKAAVRAGSTDNEEILKKIIEEEKKLISEDATEMRRFREYLQGRLLRLDKQAYEKYLRTFGPQ